jgi:hypothetical protein
VCDVPCSLRPSRCGLGLRGFVIFGATARSLRYGPATRTHPEDGVVNGLQVIGFPSCLPSSYGASDCYPDGTDSRWTQQPFLDAPRDLTLTLVTLSSYAGPLLIRTGRGFHDRYDDLRHAFPLKKNLSFLSLMTLRCSAK